MRKETKFPIPLAIAVFFISFSAIEFEIAMTRIYSLIFSHYFVFLALSVAMCGLGIGGFLATRKRFEKENLFTITALLALSFPLAIVIPLKITFLLSHPLLLALFSIFPFILTGLFISLVFKFFHPFSGAIYFSDLAGAGLGSLITILTLTLLSPINAIFFFAFLILFANFLYFRNKILIPISLVVLGFLILNNNHAILDIPYTRISEVRHIKEMVRLLSDRNKKARIEETYWNPSFRTDVVYNPASPNMKMLYTDGGTPSLMLRFVSAINARPSLERSINYVPFLTAKKGDVLSIGPGGGLDVVLALFAGFENIDAVEVNGDILRILKEYEEFNGKLIEHRSVSYRIGEGRAYLKRSEKHYDLIYLALTQTLTSSKMGLPLVESYLHTTDAYADFLSHIKPNGVVALICQNEHFMQRTVFNALLALKELAIDIRRGKNHIIIISNPYPDYPYKYLILVKKLPFSPEETERIWKHTASVKLIAEHFPYLQPEKIVDFSSSEEMQTKIRAIKEKEGIDISPTTDDKPFFFDLSSQPPSFLYWLCFGTFLSSIVSAFFVKDKKSFSFIPYFFLLGAGFMLIEVPLIQKFNFFLGNPVTTFSIILFSLLVGCGLGGLVTQKIKNPFKILPLPLTILCILLLLLFIFLQNILIQFFSLNDFLKAIVSFLILFPLGILLGIPFPLGMRRIGEISYQDTGLMWGVNGLMSVFGSCFAIIIAKNFGFKYALLLAVFIYLAILFLSLRIFKK